MTSVGGTGPFSNRSTTAAKLRSRRAPPLLAIGAVSGKARDNSSQNSRVTTKSQRGANRVQSTNGVKRATRKNLNKNRKTAQVRGLSNIALVPKGGVSRPSEVII